MKKKKAHASSYAAGTGPGPQVRTCARTAPAKSTGLDVGAGFLYKRGLSGPPEPLMVVD